MLSKNKKVVLIQPPNLCKTFTRSGSVYPPLGLCQLASVDNKNIIEVFDAEGHNLTIEQTKNVLVKHKPQIIGLSVTSFTLDIIEYWAKFGKSINATIIVGGPHASLAPKDTLEKCPSVDFVVRGEGELVINSLIDLIFNNKQIQLEGVCTRKYISPIILKVKNFENLPFPKLSNLPFNNYWCPDSISKPMTTMMTTRGCPYVCEFCSSPAVMGKKVRGWSIDQVINELKYLHFELGIKEISFVDDVFTINKKRTKELCVKIVENDIKITWFCNARADHITEELADLMKSAGCHQTYLGFESGSQQILNSIRKKATVERLTEGAEILKKYGIERSIGFVIGLPGENEDTINQSIELAKKIKPERIQFTRFTPLVGSALENHSMINAGFHNKGKDQVGLWIERMYKECGYSDWGKESW